MIRPLHDLPFLMKFPVAAVTIGFIAASLSGCGDNPGKWDVERIRSEMIQDTAMEEVVVTEQDDGSITAEGIGQKGRRFTFIIEQDPRRREIKWTSFDENGKRLKIHTSRDP